MTTFYETLTGPVRCLLALALLEITDMERPPSDFVLEKYDFDYRKRARRLPDFPCRHTIKCKVEQIDHDGECG